MSAAVTDDLAELPKAWLPEGVFDDAGDDVDALDPAVRGLSTAEATAAKNDALARRGRTQLSRRFSAGDGESAASHRLEAQDRAPTVSARSGRRVRDPPTNATRRSIGPRRRRLADAGFHPLQVKRFTHRVCPVQGSLTEPFRRFSTAFQ